MGYKKYSCNLHAPLCCIFCPNSVVVARYDALIRTKFPQIVTHILQKAFSKHVLEHSLIFIFVRALRQLQPGKLCR